MNRKSPRRIIAALLSTAALAFGGTGCGLKGEDLSLEGQTIVNDTNEADVTVGIATSIAALPALALSGNEMFLQAAVAAQSGVGKLAEPAGCLTTSVAGNVVTYAFDNCTGPWGLVKLSGRETATFSPGSTAGSLDVDLQSVDLTANGTPVDHTAHVTISIKAGVRRLEWQGSYAGTTLKGRHVKHTSDLSLRTDAAGCSTLDGTTDTKIGLRGLSEKFESLERCGPRGTCPTGTVVAVGDLTKFKVTLTFDGTNEGLATGAKGGEKSFAIDCKPAAP